METLSYYLDNVGVGKDGANYTSKHNDYAIFQKKNPHIKKMMMSFGHSEKNLDKFIDTTLFPEYEEII